MPKMCQNLDTRAIELNKRKQKKLSNLSESHSTKPKNPPRRNRSNSRGNQRKAGGDRQRSTSRRRDRSNGRSNRSNNRKGEVPKYSNNTYRQRYQDHRHRPTPRNTHQYNPERRNHYEAESTNYDNASPSSSEEEMVWQPRYPRKQRTSRDPPPRRTYAQVAGIAADLKEYIEPVFQSLSEETLLQKCLLGATQNRNESFNSFVWARAPKTEYVTRPTVEIATSQAVLVFNSGSQALVPIIECLGANPGPLCSSYLAAKTQEGSTA